MEPVLERRAIGLAARKQDVRTHGPCRLPVDVHDVADVVEAKEPLPSSRDNEVLAGVVGFRSRC